MKRKISNLYDSHVHFLMTGALSSRLDLTGLKSSEELRDLRVSPSHFQGDWLVGFGWDEYAWPEKGLNLNKDFLDQLFPNYPVLLVRKDGHRAWVNSMALKQNPHVEKDEQCLKDSDGNSVGILLENAHYQLLRSIPSFSKDQIHQQLLKAQSLFHQAGFTHVRDLSTSEEQWDVMQEMDRSLKWKLFLKANLVCDRLADLPAVLKRAQKMKPQETRHLQVEGVKFFYDGSLGSETALLSVDYGSHHQGLRMWEPSDLESAIGAVWTAGLDVAIHAIGDQAVDEVVDCARRVSARGLVGKLNLEHVQVLRPETLQKMKSLHLQCHLQPCHFLSDQLWLNEKLRGLSAWAFPWEALRKAKIPMSFGSDSPIEPPSLFRNLKALELATLFGIPQLESDGMTFHCFPGNESHTVIDEENQKISEVWFEGELVF